jgi:UDP-glucuronate decarboxylase
MNIFVTGISGFFGTALIRYLHTQNFKGNIHGISRSNLNLDRLRAEFSDFHSLNLHCCNLFDKDKVIDLLKKYNITHIFHFAVNSTDGPRMRLLDRYQQIYDSTDAILSMAYSADIKNVLLTSSGAVYVNLEIFKDHKPFCEGQTMAPSFDIDGPSTYRMAKFNSEFLSKIYATERRMNIRVVRCFSFVGEDLPLDKHFAVGNFLNDALHFRRVLIRGTGLDIRSYMYQDDLAEWLMVIGTHQMNGWCVYNIGSDVPISLRELALKINQHLPDDYGLTIIGGTSLKANYYVPNIDKAKDELGLTIRHNLDEALIKTITGLRRKLLS